MKKYNYHTHTYRCHHAMGEDEAYVQAAIKAGYEEIGFSDHCAWNYEGFVSGMRMREDEIEGYVSSVLSLKEKYKNDISIKLGFECEFFRERMPWLKDTLKKYNFDYVILGHHYSPNEEHGVYNGFVTRPKEVENYTTDVLDAMETGLFSYVAHPDLFMRGYPYFDKTCEECSKMIIKKSIETGVPIEYNLLGFEHSKADGKAGYPYPDFWMLAGEMGATAVVGIDAHNPKAYLNDALRDEAIANLKKYGVRFTDEIKFLK